MTQPLKISCEKISGDNVIWDISNYGSSGSTLRLVVDGDELLVIYKISPDILEKLRKLLASVP